MAAGDDPLAGGSYSKLLFSDEDSLVNLANSDGLFGPSISSVFPVEKCPKMLCFGGDDYQQQQQQQQQKECENDYASYLVSQKITQKSGVTCTDFSSTPSINNSRIKKRRNGNGDEGVAVGLSLGAGAPARNQRNGGKKAKAENSGAAMGNGHAKVKVRKEKLGDRIAALQHLVSPYGKSDTASVLHEATGYIKFLHDQVQVLSSPYLQPLSSSNQGQLPEGEGSCASRGFKQEDVETGGNEPSLDLRSRGLCLVPVEYATHMSTNNGAAYWSTAAAMGESVWSTNH